MKLCRPKKLTGGFEYGLAQEVAKRVGLSKVKVVNVSFDALVAGQAQGFDIALEIRAPSRPDSPRRMCHTIFHAATVRLSPVPPIVLGDELLLRAFASDFGFALYLERVHIAQAEEERIQSAVRDPQSADSEGT